MQGTLKKCQKDLESWLLHFWRVHLGLDSKHFSYPGYFSYFYMLCSPLQNFVPRGRSQIKLCGTSACVITMTKMIDFDVDHLNLFKILFLFDSFLKTNNTNVLIKKTWPLIYQLRQLSYHFRLFKNYFGLSIQVCCNIPWKVPWLLRTGTTYNFPILRQPISYINTQYKK